MNFSNLTRLLVAVFYAGFLVACNPEIDRIVPLYSVPEGGGEISIEGDNLDKPATLVLADDQLEILSQDKKRIVAAIAPGKVGQTQLTVSVGKTFTETHPFKYVFIRIVTVDDARDGEALARASLVDRKDAVLATVRPLGVELISDQPDLPTMVLGAPSLEALQAIETHPQVKGFDSPRPIRTDATESLPIINHVEAMRLSDLVGPNPGIGTSVLVLDTGIDWRNPFFNCRTLTSPECRVAAMVEFGPDDGRAEDGTFHGTNVSAIVLSVARNTKVIGGDVIGPATDSSMIAEAVQWAVENRDTYNIAAINMSISVPGTESTGPCYNDPIAAAIRYARYNGIVVATSTSNDFLSDRMPTPACSPLSVRVGATGDAGDTLDKEMDFSNAWANAFMVAPGSFITAGGHTMQGTSQASPHVAGAAAIMRAAFPDASTEFIANRLQYTGPLIESKNERAGPRRLDLYAALVDHTFRPAPMPPHYEWTWTGTRDSTRRPVSDRPKLKVKINPRYVADLNTGLEWVVVSEDHLPEPAEIRTAQGICRRVLGPAHYRLPTRSELMTLWDWEAPRSSRLNVPELGAVAEGNFWTMSPADDYDEDGFFVWTGEDGYLYRETAIIPDFARTPKNVALCVSSTFLVPREVPERHFTDEGGWVHDTASGLRWLKKTAPHQTFAEATDWCAARTDGGKHWRLPSAREAMSIVDVVERDGSYIDRSLFGEEEPRVTMSDFPSDPGSASPYEWWYLDERHGRLLQGGGSGHVRCVENLDPAASHDGVHVGDVEIIGDDADEDYQRFKRSGFREIHGDLLINAPELPRVLLQRLERVDGNVVISNLDKADFVALPFLSEVTGNVEIVKTNAREIDLRRLKIVAGNFVLDENRELGVDQSSGTNGDGLDAPIQLRNLQAIGGELRIHRNAKLKSFGFNQLRSVGHDLEVSSNNSLERFGFFIRTIGDNCPQVGSCGSLWVSGNPVMGNFTMTALEKIRWGLDVQANRNLEFYSAVAEMNGLYRVEGNPSLCAYDRVDGGLRASLNRRIMSEISVTRNKLDTVYKRCSSRCPNEDRCDLWPSP
ncbi:DUF1566 domain-containing protein [Aurantiacibacter suaedae]|uniref:Lcl domain-containing protein n=1 Tax=Aurantiacibacter suaedae TaxID=2545755 RepID=UPI001386C02E|nr:DUF1566 domain-containing protein [Aurantiacibacter suaedae]